MKTDEYPIIEVLDHGFVQLVDSMGDDRRVVDAARVSYQKGTTKVSTDRGLIRYLLRKRHTTPFEKVRFEFHVKLPLFVARQWMRHRTGSFNEVSGRYSEMPNEIYIPDPLRKQSDDNKQGSSSEIVTGIPVGTEEFSDGHLEELQNPQEFFSNVTDEAYASYCQILESGAAKELARGVLPVNIYTEFYWTVDLWNLMHFLRLRLDSHAQYEIRVFAEAIVDLINEQCDVGLSMEAFQDYILDAPDLTKFEVGILKEIVSELDASSISPVSLSDLLAEKISNNKQMSKREKKETSLQDIFGK